jgi:hypothetical protein
MKSVSMFVMALALAFVTVSAVKAEDAKKETAAKDITGTVGCAHCSYSDSLKGVEGCAAAIKSGDKVYVLKASEKADEATKEKIKNYKKELKGDFVVTGTVKEEGGNQVLVADAIKASEKK